MKKILYISLCLCLLCGSALAQEVESSDSTSPETSEASDGLERAALRENELLSEQYMQLQSRYNALVDEKSKFNKSINASKKAKAAKEKELAKLQARVSLDDPNVHENTIRAYKGKIENLKADTLALVNEIADIDREIAQYNARNEELEVALDNANNQVVSKYSTYVDLPLSKITQERLTAIKTECDGYPSNETVRPFAIRVDRVLHAKREYDNAVKILGSRFKKADVDGAMQALTTVKGLQPEQQAEIDKVSQQLAVFEEGVATFKAFINKLNDRRDGASSYSPRDYNDDLPFIMNGLDDKVAKCIEPVPYLNEAYNQYREILKANPMERPSIESEILNQ